MRVKQARGISAWPSAASETTARRIRQPAQNIEDAVDFFHMDALSSAVALKVNCDVQLTLMASSLYRYLGQQIGHGYETAKSAHLFGDFINATATLEIDERTIQVHYQKRAHNPLLLAAGFDQTDVRVPWLGKQLQFVFG